MKTQLYKYDGTPLFEVMVDASSSQSWSLMSDNKLSLSFELEECVVLTAGCYIEFDNTRFYLLTEYKPTMVCRSAWKYDLTLGDAASWLSITLALKTTDGENAPLFKYTGPAVEHAAIIVANLNRLMGTDKWKVGSVISTENITIDYSGKYCSEVLQEIVDIKNTEWWIDDMTLNIGRAEFGDPIELGYQNGLLGDIIREQSDNSKSYRYLYPVGSTRNIDPTKYGYDRLQLPNGRTYIDMNVEQGIAELFEEAAFAHIFPRYEGTVQTVRTQIANGNSGSFVIYYFSDSNLPFNPNDYEIAGLKKQISFLSGELMGEDFEVNYNPSSKEFEIITKYPENSSNIQLPGGLLIPNIGDKYVIWNITMPTEYYSLASQELLEAAEAFAQKYIYDGGIYHTSLDYIDVQLRSLRLRPGQRVRLQSPEYFPKTGHYDSRITRVTRSLWYPNEMNIDISSERSMGVIKKLSSDVKSAQTKSNTLSATLSTLNAAFVAHKMLFDEFFEKDSDGNIHAKLSLWSSGGITAGGVGSGGSGGGGVSYDRLDSWADYSADKSGWVLSALLGNNLNTRLTSVENAGYITQSVLAPYALRSEIPSLEGYFLASNFNQANIKTTLGISDWALATSKPAYTASEVGALGVNATAVDSSKLGGYASTTYMRASGQYSDSLNDLTTLGIYRMGGTITDGPTGAGSYGNLMVVRSNGWDTLAQLYFNINNNRVFVRSGSNTSYLTRDWSAFAFTSDIPTKLSQLTDDVVAGKYLSKSGGQIIGEGDYAYVQLRLSGDIATIGFQQYGVDKGVVGWLGNTGIRLQNLNGYGLAVRDSNEPIYYWGENGSVQRILLHSGNYSDYALSTNGGTVNGSIYMNGYFLFGNSQPIMVADTDGVYQSALYLSTGNNFSIGYGTSVVGKRKTLLFGNIIEFKSNGGEDNTLVLNADRTATFSSTVSAPSFIGNLTGNASAQYISYSNRDVNLWDIDNRTARYFALGDTAQNTPSGVYALGSILMEYSWDANAGAQLLSHHSKNNIFYRSRWNGAFKDWREIAFTDSNVASATKLATPRTIWGQSFDGTKSIVGTLNDVDIIRGSNSVWLIGISGENVDLGSSGNSGYRRMTNKNGKIELTALGGLSASCPYISTDPQLGQLDSIGSSSVTFSAGYGLYCWIRNTGRAHIQVGDDSRSGTSLAYDMVLQPLGGNVAIGGATADEKLHVHGNGKFTGALLSQALLSAGISIGCDASGVASDNYAREINTFANKLYLQYRGGDLDLCGGGGTTYLGGALEGKTANFTSLTAPVITTNSLTIGGATLTYDSANEALCINGNMYALGGITAGGAGISAYSSLETRVARLEQQLNIS